MFLASHGWQQIPPGYLYLLLCFILPSRPEDHPVPPQMAQRAGNGSLPSLTSAPRPEHQGGEAGASGPSRKNRTPVAWGPGSSSHTPGEASCSHPGLGLVPRPADPQPRGHTCPWPVPPDPLLSQHSEHCRRLQASSATLVLGKAAFDVSFPSSHVSEGDVDS